jgi:hypothetical protein
MFLNEYDPSVTACRPMKPAGSQTLRNSFAFVAASIVLVAGCAESAEGPTEVLLERNFQLQVGQSAHVAEANLTVGFDAVTSDSRCGKGEVCIWEGDATVVIWLRPVGVEKERHELHTSTKSPNSVIYKGFSIRLVSLFPLPLSGQTPAAEHYIATFQVTRGLSGHENIL